MLLLQRHRTQHVVVNKINGWWIYISFLPSVTPNSLKIRFLKCHFLVILVIFSNLVIFQRLSAGLVKQLYLPLLAPKIKLKLEIENPVEQSWKKVKISQKSLEAVSLRGRVSKKRENRQHASFPRDQAAEMERNPVGNTPRSLLPQ